MSSDATTINTITITDAINETEMTLKSVQIADNSSQSSDVQRGFKPSRPKKGNNQWEERRKKANETIKLAEQVITSGNPDASEVKVPSEITEIPPGFSASDKKEKRFYNKDHKPKFVPRQEHAGPRFIPRIPRTPETKSPDVQTSELKSEPKILNTSSGLVLKTFETGRGSNGTNSSIDFRSLKTQALEFVRDKLLSDCFGIVREDEFDSLNALFTYQMKYSKTFVLDISDDTLVVELSGEKFEFSRGRFLRDKTFQFKLREKFAERLPEVWLLFFEGREPGTFCIRFVKKNADAQKETPNEPKLTL